MATEYTGFQSIINAALGEYQSLGFNLKADDDHILTLYYTDTIIARFSQTGVAFSMICKTCQEYLTKLGLGSGLGESGLDISDSGAVVEAG